MASSPAGAAPAKLAVPPDFVDLIRRCSVARTRALVVIVGDRAKDAVPVLHQLQSRLGPPSTKPTVLWCYKSELGFSTHKKKRMKQIKKLVQRGLFNAPRDDPFELFTASTQIQWCYYKETERVLGRSFNMLVLQDFEALTPNVLARTVETVEGGGMVVFLLNKLDSLRKLYELTMDAHARFTTASHPTLRPRFNERFTLSLRSCQSCAIIDDAFQLVQPIVDAGPSDPPVPFLASSSSLSNPLLAVCKTADQVSVLESLCRFVGLTDVKKVTTLVAARGRGKSAALGLAIAHACAVCTNVAELVVSAPHENNVGTVFDFIKVGFKALGLDEHAQYTMVGSQAIDVKKDGRRTRVRFMAPEVLVKAVVGRIDVLVVDEAAAIPLPLVRALILVAPLVVLSSTVDGYEGTGRSLTLKLLQELKATRNVDELTMSAPIRYAAGDAVEAWLDDVLCLTCTPAPLSSSPPPDQCRLFLIDRDTLFSRHKVSEAFLKRVMAVLVVSHYRNSPNDLQLLSDAPAHRLMVLLPAAAPDDALPDVLCVAQLAMEGSISAAEVQEELRRGQRSAGDLIPWSMSQQFQDDGFARLSGARIVRIATHPDAMGMGYGKAMLAQIIKFYAGELESAEAQEGEFEAGPMTSEQSDEDRVKPRKRLRPLLVSASDLRPHSLDWLGVSYGLTLPLFEYWAKAGFAPVYCRQTAHESTGSHTCMMLKGVKSDGLDAVSRFASDFGRRYAMLLGGAFRDESCTLALSMLAATKPSRPLPLTTNALESHVTSRDRARLDAYSRNLVDFHMVADLTPRLAALVFEGRVDVTLSALQLALLVGMGLQRKDVEALAVEVKMPVQQVLAMFNKAIRKLSLALGGVGEGEGGDAGQQELDESALREIKEGQTVSLPRLPPSKDDIVAQALAADKDDSAAATPRSSEGKGAKQPHKDKKRASQERKFAGREKKHKRG